MNVEVSFMGFLYFLFDEEYQLFHVKFSSEVMHTYHSNTKFATFQERKTFEQVQMNFSLTPQQKHNVLIQLITEITSLRINELIETNKALKSSELCGNGEMFKYLDWHRDGYTVMITTI